MFGVPVTYEETLEDGNERRNEDNDTYELTPVPKDNTVVGGRWVYFVKTVIIILVRRNTKLDM